MALNEIKSYLSGFRFTPEEQQELDRLERDENADFAALNQLRTKQGAAFNIYNPLPVDKRQFLLDAIRSGQDLSEIYGGNYADAQQLMHNLGLYRGKDESMIIPANPVGYSGGFKFDPVFGSSVYKDLAMQVGQAMGLSEEQIRSTAGQLAVENWYSGGRTKNIMGFSDYGKLLTDRLADAAQVDKARVAPLYDAVNQVDQQFRQSGAVESDSSGFFKQVAKDLSANPFVLAGIAALTGGAAAPALGAVGAGAAAGATVGGIKGVSQGTFKDIAKGVIGGGAIGAAGGALTQGIGNLINGQDFTSGLLTGSELPPDYFVGGGIDNSSLDLGQSISSLEGLGGAAGQDFFGGLKTGLPDSAAIGGGDLGMGVAPADPVTGIRDLGGVGLSTGTVAAGKGGLDLLSGAVKKGVPELIGSKDSSKSGSAAGLAALLGGLATMGGGGDGGQGGGQSVPFTRIPLSQEPTPVRLLKEGGEYTSGVRTDPLLELNRSPLQFAREGMEERIRGFFKGGSVQAQGIASIPKYAKGRMVKGQGDGMSDDVEAVIDGKEPVMLASEEYIIPAQAVSALGNGSSEAGAKVLDAMVKRTYAQQTGTPKQMKPMKLDKVLPA